MEAFSNFSHVVRSLEPGRSFASYPQGVSIQKTSLSTLLCYTYPKLDWTLKNLLSHLIKHRNRMQPLLCIHPSHIGAVAVILPQIKKFVFHMQVGRSASHILTFVFYVQKPKEVG
jgi:hypothetical protein